MRQLVMRLEYVDALKLAHPYTKGLESVYYCLSEEEAQAISRGEIPEAVAHRKKEDIEGKEGAKTMYATSFFVGLSIKPKEGASGQVDWRASMCATSANWLIMKAGATGPRKLDISFPTNEFQKMVKGWDGYDESVMHIQIRHIKQFVTSRLKTYRETDTHVVPLFPTSVSSRASAKQWLVPRSALEARRQVTKEIMLCLAVFANFK